MRCPRCGNENPGTNRFCGMCGATLLQAGEVAPPAKAVEPSARVIPAASPAKVEAPQSVATARTPAPVAAPEESPSISGPSFLGLNQPAPVDTSRGASLSIDPSAAPSSRNLDYLLDDEEAKRGGWGKFVVILIALALAAGLGYWRWKNGSFPSLLSGSKKPAAAAQTVDDAPPDSSAPATNATPAPSVPAANTSTQPAATPPASSAATPPATQPAVNQPAASQPASADDSDSPAAAAAPAHPPAEKDPAEDSVDNVPPAAKPKPHPAEPVTTEAPKPVRSSDPVAEAQKYLYGKGVKQDCDRGMRLLKPAADKANPKAMIEMGALYSAGLCAPRDLPTAYRWFAMALHKDPDNQAVQTDLQKLWTEMTQPERQLAIRLSQ